MATSEPISSYLRMLEAYGVPGSDDREGIIPGYI